MKNSNIKGCIFGLAMVFALPMVNAQYKPIKYDNITSGNAVGISAAMLRAEDARKIKDKSLSREMQLVFDSLLTPFEKSNGKATADYYECLAWYRQLAKSFPSYCKLLPIGYGDAGKEIYLLKLFGERMGRMDRFGNGDEGVLGIGITKPKVKILINNNIHPGEPEGTDASMILLRDLLFFGQYWQKILPYLELHVVCQYNVDGTLVRNHTLRANQNGPVEYGFRGNAQNLDLNRDFVKLDSRNSKALVQLMSSEHYHLFIDNHTSNGADYQYVLTYFHTRPEKLHPALVPLMNSLDSKLKRQLLINQWPTAPYVESMKIIPDSGIFAFWESPRYATGFAALHHTIGFTVETHMLKSFDQRMLATLAFLEQFLIAATLQDLLVKFELVRKQSIDFQEIHIKGAKANNEPGGWMPLHYQLDQSRYEMIDFQGFTSGYKPSLVTGKNRLYYDREKPWNKKIRYYSNYIATDSVEVPRAYFVPYAYEDVILKLRRNNIICKPIPMDTTVKLKVSYILDYKTVSQPYEKHYLHHSVKTRDTVIFVQLRAGDFVVYVKPNNAHFLTAVLEARAPDSYFAWNAFDGILMQKEGYSDYVFEDLAADWLAKHPEQKAEFEQKKALNKEFANDAAAQLNWVYRQSEHYERSHNLYPIYKLMVD